MPQRFATTMHDHIEASIRNAGSIGALERLAGIGQTPDERYAFWQPFTQLSAGASLEAGVAELKRRIRAQGGSPTQARAPRGAGAKARYIRSVSVRDGDTPDYFDLRIDRAKVARALRGETALQRLRRKHDMTAEEVVARFQPGAHCDPATGAVTLNAGWDQEADEGQIEVVVWSLVRREVETALAERLSVAP